MLLIFGSVSSAGHQLRMAVDRDQRLERVDDPGGVRDDLHRVRILFRIPDGQGWHFSARVDS